MSDSKNFPYATFLDVKFPQSTIVDAPALIKGVTHRTRAPEGAVILMVETAAIIPTGDA